MDTVDYTEKLTTTPEFNWRAAHAWIRAADAGVIDADELAWLLARLPGGRPWPADMSGDDGSRR